MAKAVASERKISFGKKKTGIAKKSYGKYNPKPKI